MVPGNLELRFQSCNLHLAWTMRVKVIKADLAHRDDMLSGRKLANEAVAVFGIVRMYADSRKHLFMLRRERNRLFRALLTSSDTDEMRDTRVM